MNLATPIPLHEEDEDDDAFLLTEMIQPFRSWEVVCLPSTPE
jgi:hypothetical protein